MKDYNKVIFEISKPGRTGYKLQPTDVESIDIESCISKELIRTDALELPEVSELQVVRHYTNLSMKNYGVESGIYPLGSCTMKYNPKINEDVASLKGFNNIHPLQDVNSIQGSLKLMYDLSKMLEEITGMDKITLQPSAGSQGELTGLMIIKEHLKSKGLEHKTKIIIPDSAHGTNPASVTMAGFEMVEIKSNELGRISIESLKKVLDENVAGLMLTNPNTLGLFETEIQTIATLIHDVGGLLYYDGANMNANMGITRPGDMGFDIVHLNLHKTFSTPHGGGGPGSGPVGVKSHLINHLPNPFIIKNSSGYALEDVATKSIGKVKAFYGNFGVLVRAYTYILSMGYDGLRKASELAVLNANYMKASLKEYYNLPFKGVCKHEFVLAGLKKVAEEEHRVSTVDVAKAIIDKGYHPPTIYFPLIVEQALMIEPTETEDLESLDDYINSLIEISELACSSPNTLHQAPQFASVKRLDEVGAARKPRVSWRTKDE